MASYIVVMFDIIVMFDIVVMTFGSSYQFPR